VAEDLTGQVAIVTGGGRGIGRAIAQALAAAGAAVAATARTEDQLRETVALIEQAGGRALAIAGDVADPATVQRTVRAVEETYGPVDALVNNAAALGPASSVVETDAAAWWQACAVNLYAPFLWSQAVLPGMLARRRGHIINVATSVPRLRRGEAYHVSKSALVRLSEGLAAETRAQGVAVFAIHPGGVWTAMSQEGARRLLGLAGLPDDLEDWRQNVLNLPPEVPARLCVALASGRADALSGRYVSVFDDLDDLITRADEIRQQDLYTLRLRT
jgi:NAD(P)-dependent dehydrogenase (short-subunit alcohol dehydrogenase family)